MQDVGCRIYTFAYTMANCMSAARKFGKKVVVCDRPNPINGRQVAGNVLEPEQASFVGLVAHSDQARNDSGRTRAHVQ